MEVSLRFEDFVINNNYGYWLDNDMLYPNYNAPEWVVHAINNIKFIQEDK